MTEEAIEVDPREALAEGRPEGESPITPGEKPGEKPNGTPTPEPPVQEEKPKKEDVVDTIVPKAELKEWTFTDPQGNEKKYVQRPLSYFGKMQWFSLVGDVIDKAVSGEDGVRVSSLFGGTVNPETMSVSDFRDADTFFQAIGKILVYVPDFLEKSYCIWLGVPEFERPWAVAVMTSPETEGGLSDEDGIEIVEIFIDQNWEAIEGFFRDKLSSLRDRIQSHRPQSNESPPSKP